MAAWFAGSKKETLLLVSLLACGVPGVFGASVRLTLCVRPGDSTRGGGSAAVGGYADSGLWP